MKKLILTTVILSVIFFSFIPPKSKKLTKILKGSWAFVPAGEVNLENIKQTTSDFYISKTEITNLEYITFLNAIKNTPEYDKALPDTTVWSRHGNIYNGYQNQYFRYPGFRMYPVVGVSFEGANLYCKWLESQINSQLQAPERVKVKLPTEAEWTIAALGGKSKAMYPWGSPYLKNGKGKFLANFRSEEKIKNPKGNILTNEVSSFYPNEYGIFQMSGNVSEMIENQNITKGGSWNSEGNYLEISNRQVIQYPSNEVGFRPVLILSNN
ncbi:MAG: formylglycine-generating enzyme family protein [Bacteroidetes bacterium]|nr:formylglycine-generating enzyme family protein [Bacteroidota bacterium]